ncbi:RNA polymerase I-specific transcription initiation factor RRN3-like protein [Cinnamomum micranthum f. kanehirae]|uniref:RNA polymerase I-specific transcription initiation factor RRN3-like protein n=1 Tax=Cinnamomum micranthum f. kanehirae TaxID=337451 RepID=A0A3S3MQ13_9MAGN|nr:RNA polymerase I-specific transcription initiation factor RRN3-like protein [Cinnamomum micranthum f. kanehirae]
MGMELPTEEAGFHEMNDGYISDSEVVFHVRSVLKLVSQGDNEQYNQLVEVMNCTQRLEPDQEAMLVASLKALSGAVSSIDVIFHETLLSSIFGMSMWNCGRDAMDALVELIINLAVSSGNFVDACLDMLVCNFLPPPTVLPSLSQTRGLARKKEVLDRVHSALRSIADLVPLAPLRLMPIVLQRMPRVHAKEALIVIYVESMLRLESSSIGELVGSTMLMAVVDRLIDLDVEIGWEDILQEDTGKGIFDMELEDIEENADEDDGKIGNELPKGALSRQNLGGNLVAEKLDSLMELACEHLKSCAESGRLVKVFETLIQSFEMTVLNAHKSKFAQFVVFYACSLDPENCAMKFATFLADVFMCRTTPPLTRMSAVSYLASYLSRGKFLPSSFVASILKRLVQWCFEYTQFWDSQETAFNPRAHRVFYSGCQAVMYVLCFRMRLLIEVPHLKYQLFHMPLEAILRHPLDPLKVCLPSIVEEFLRQAKEAPLFTMSETFLFNDQLESEFSKAFGGMERLDMFFPFDPCLLKKSDRYIRPNFVFWSMVRATYDDDEDDDADVDIYEDDLADENAASFRENGLAQSVEDHDLDLINFESSLSKMSISPKASLKHGFPGQFDTPTRMPAKIRPSTSPDW